MLLDSSFYELSVKQFEKHIYNMFRDEMIQMVKTCAFKDHGSFILSYKYVPLNYTINIENEIRTFTIMIKDQEGASTFLSRIESFENFLNENNIYNAVVLLKKVLEKNNFSFYFYKNNKLYKKDKEEIKRVKNLGEIVNG